MTVCRRLRTRGRTGSARDVDPVWEESAHSQYLLNGKKSFKKYPYLGMTLSLVDRDPGTLPNEKKPHQNMIQFLFRPTAENRAILNGRILERGNRDLATH